MKSGLLLLSSRCRAGVAQSVEQLICNQQVGGSSPSTSSIVATSYGSSHFRASAKIRSLRCGSSSSRKRFAGFRSEKRRREHKLNMGEFPSGQRGQTVNLLAMPSVVRIHLPPPTKNTLLSTKSVFFVYPSRRLGISSRVSVYIIKGGKPPLYLVTAIAVHILPCGLMRYNSLRN